VKKVIRRAAIALLALVLAAGGTFAILVWLGDRKAERRLEVRVVPVPYTRDRAAIKQGKYLFETRGCAECHGADGRGIAFVDTADVRLKAPDITTGAGGVVSDYNEGDWVRAIRHGVKPSGKPLRAMPSEDYNRMSDADLAALVGYIRMLPPVRGEPAEIRFPVIVKALYGAGVIKDAAEKIDHRRPPSPAIAPAVNPEYGAYVATMCAGCHRSGFEGGPIAGAPPDWPPAADLRPGGIITIYDTPEKFVAMMRTGERPGGGQVSRVMPFISLRALNDTDLNAIYAYLRTLPPR
jgi:mono/diheme cytochrome c family protein